MAIIKATDVAYPTLQCPDLDIQEQFLIHFGMHTVLKTDDTFLLLNFKYTLYKCVSCFHFGNADELTLG